MYGGIAVQPGVVVGRYVRPGRGEQLDHRADRAVLRQDRPAVRAVARRVEEALGEVPVEDRGDRVHVGRRSRRTKAEPKMNASVMALEISDLPPPETVPACGTTWRLGTVPIRLHAVWSWGCLGNLDAVAVRAQVAPGRRAAAIDRDWPSVPVHETVMARERVVRVGRHQHDVRLLLVEGVPLRLGHEPFRVALQNLGERVGVTARGFGVLPAEVVAGEDQRAAGVLLLGVAEQVRRVADLGLDLLLAVAEVVVGDDGDDHATSVAGADLEGLAVVVALVLLLPAHPVALLPVGGLARRGAGRAPSSSDRVRCGARITQPVWPVQVSGASEASFSGR